MLFKNLVNDEFYCYSDLGYQENEREVKYDYNKKIYEGYFLLYLIGSCLLAATIPYLGLLVSSFFILYTLKPKYKHYFVMKWTDKKNVPTLRPVYQNSELDTDYPKYYYLAFFIFIFIASSFVTKHIDITILFIATMIMVGHIYVKNNTINGELR